MSRGFLGYTIFSKKVQSVQNPTSEHGLVLQQLRYIKNDGH